MTAPKNRKAELAALLADAPEDKPNLTADGLNNLREEGRDARTGPESPRRAAGGI